MTVTTTLGVVGRGRAARSLVSVLGQRGVAPVWWWGRSDGAPLAGLPAVDLVLLAVSDGAIAAVASELGGRPGAGGEVWLHLSGSLPGAAARATPACPRSAGCLHPLQALDGSAVGAEHLAGVTAGIDGEPAAVEAAEALARSLGMVPRRLAPGSKALYHAAAVTAAGHATALFAQAERMLAGCGFAEEEARAALRPLLAGAVANLASRPPAAAITGPMARGDVATIAAHLAALDALDAGLAATYRALAGEALALSRAGLAPETAAALEDTLAAGGPGRG